MDSVPAPIFEFNAARSSIVEEVVNRITSQTRDPLLVLNEAAYLETRRLQRSPLVSDSAWDGRFFAGVRLQGALITPSQNDGRVRH